MNQPSEPSKIAIAFAPSDLEVAARLFANIKSKTTPPHEVYLAANQIDNNGKSPPLQAGVTHLIVLCSKSGADSFVISQQIEYFLEKRPKANILPIKIASTRHLKGNFFIPSALSVFRGKDKLLHEMHPPKVFANVIGEHSDFEGIALAILDKCGIPRPISRSRITPSAIAATVVVVLAGTALVFNNSVTKLKNQAANATLFAETVLIEITKSLPKDVRAKHLASLGDATLTALADKPIQALSDDELSRRAKLLHFVGEAHDDVGEPNKAISAFRLADTFTSELSSRDPDDNERLFEHSQSAYWLGDSAYRKGDLKAARKAFTAYQNLSKTLLSREPLNKRYTAEVAYSHLNTGVIELETGSPRRALTSFSQAVSMLDRDLIDAGFATEKDRANFLGWQADAYLELGNFSEARQSILLQKDIYDRLFKTNPKSAAGATRLANALSKLADIEVDNGDDGLALSHLNKAADLMKIASQNNPNNLKYRTIYISVIQKTAELKLAQGNIFSAKLLIDESRRFRANNDTNGANDTRYREMAWMKLLSAKIALKSDALEFALSEVSSALLDLERAKSGSLKRRHHFLLGNAEFLRGLILEQSGQGGEAAIAWREAVYALDSAQINGSRRAKDILSRSLFKLGEIKNANALHQELLTASYRNLEFISFWENSSDNSNLVLNSINGEIKHDK